MIDIAYVYSLLVGVLLWNLDPFLLDNDLVSFPDNLSRPFYIFPIVILIELIFIFSLPYYAEQFRKIISDIQKESPPKLRENHDELLP